MADHVWVDDEVSIADISYRIMVPLDAWVSSVIEWN